MSFIHVRDVVKRYGTRLSVDHLNLSIEAGEIFGLLGPNGAGKSTTIKLMAGLLAMDRGEITIDGYSVSAQPLEVKRRIGLVPQELAIYESSTAAENVTFFARLFGLRGSLLTERVQEALEFVGLSDRAKEKPRTFSGGMKRRLNIACAIMHRPKLIIMDEPTVGIDPQSRNHILESVKKLNAMGSTILYTSHYVEEVEAISTRVGIMERGRLIVTGSKEELREKLSREEKLVVKVNQIPNAAQDELKRHPRIADVRALDNELELVLLPSQMVLQDILFILAKHQVHIYSLVREEPNLESLFLSLTGQSLRD